MTYSQQDRSGDAPILDHVIDPVGQVTRAVWWLVLIRGILAVLFGIVALIAPVTTFYAIVFVFAAYALVEGIVEIVHAVRVRGRDPRWGWLLALGIIAAIAGIVAFISPTFAGLYGGTFLIALIAFYAVLMGIAGFPAAAGAAGGRKVFGYIVAVLTIVAGVILAIAALVNPVATVFSLIWIAGIWAVVSGITLIIAAIMARATRPGTGAAPARG
jgi:uncharacterized membrane protein HdeD (DUF308 family)